jgi:hypothetical protein
MISLGDGPLGTWRVEEVDVRADHVAVFGHEPPRPLALGIMSDSDDSCGAATAWFAGFEFRGP